MSSPSRYALTYLEAGDSPASRSILQQSLTVRSVISTTSSYAQRTQHESASTELCQIGEGLQGVIFEQLGHPLAMKKEKPGNETLPSNLKSEYIMHSAVHDAFCTFGPVVNCAVRVPCPHPLIPEPESQEFWSKCLPKIPEEYRQPGDMLYMDRILPVTKDARKALIAEFYPRCEGEQLSTDTIDRIANIPSNKHALIRTYFGKKKTTTFTPETFSLRNFPLCLQDMENIGLNVDDLVESLGQAYAIMHWGAGVDGDDVEFVLGTTAEENSTADVQQRTVRYFLLDFGQCQRVDLTKEDYIVYQGFKGAMVTGDSQLFIPHYANSSALFEVFKRAYTEAGHKILIKKGLTEKFSMDEFMKEYQEYAEDFL